MSKKLDDDTLMMKARSAHYISAVHPSIFRSLQGGKIRKDPSSSHSLLLCSLLPFGEQFHFSALNGSETSSAKIPLSLPSFLSLPSIPPFLPHSSFERSGNLLIPNGIVSLQASALHGRHGAASRQTLPRGASSEKASISSATTRGARLHGRGFQPEFIL